MVIENWTDMIGFGWFGLIFRFFFLVLLTPLKPSAIWGVLNFFLRLGACLLGWHAVTLPSWLGVGWLEGLGLVVGVEANQTNYMLRWTAFICCLDLGTHKYLSQILLTPKLRMWKTPTKWIQNLDMNMVYDIRKVKDNQ